MSGWNLLGNSSAAPIDVTTSFGDAGKITSVWKWNKASKKWAFYAPSMNAGDLASYAQGKGYDVLTSIDAKEGFWINAKSSMSVGGPSAAGVSLTAPDLQAGWNLVASADNKTPSQLNSGLSDSLTTAGKAIATAWAWDATNSKWKFYAPSLESQGGTALADYIATKSFLPFTTALTASEGFWLNVGAGAATGSADDYNSNTSGIITGRTLKRWKDDWMNQRPPGISGNLVILQISAGEAGYEYITTNGQNAFTYLSSGPEWVMTRSNGVINTPTAVINGSAIDAILKKYAIDPQNDMIVIAIGAAADTNATTRVAYQARAWFALRYWGLDSRNVALLNGGNKWQSDSGALTAADFAATVPPAPGTGIKTIRSVLADNTFLQATVGDMMAILPSADVNAKNDGVFIWDARSVTRYSAGVKRERRDGSGDTVCTTAYCDAAASYDYMSAFENGGSRQGHPFGAMSLNFVNLLDAAKGYSFKSKAEIASYMNGELDANGYGFVGGSFNPVGASNAYQPGDVVYAYCETSYSGSVATVASSVILGRTARLYVGAMFEWNSLSNLPDSTGNNILPADSPWRTDVKSYYRPAKTAAQVTPRTIVNARAQNSNGIIAEDRAYKTSTATTGSTTSTLATTTTTSIYQDPNEMGM